MINGYSFHIFVLRFMMLITDNNYLVKRVYLSLNHFPTVLLKSTYFMNERFRFNLKISKDVSYVVLK